MARATIRPPRLQLPRLTRVTQLRALARTAPVRTAIVHLGVVLVSFTQLALAPGPTSGSIAMWIVIVVGLAVLRVMTTGQPLATSTLVLEPIGVALLLAGTGGPSSQFLTLSLAGIWWASRTTGDTTARVYRIDRRSGALRLHLAAIVEATPKRGALLIYGPCLVGAYLVLVLPQAARAGTAGETIQNAAMMVGFVLLSEALVRIARSAREARAASAAPVLDAQQLAVRAGLARALRTFDIPFDAVMAAGRVGLTALQAELLAYLLLGLSNQEIADAVQVSEATVRYRLTRLYRTLGVSSRREAAERARDIGLTGLAKHP
jgi:DNA-binding CsgD family transcriptional regulator